MSRNRYLNIRCGNHSDSAGQKVEVKGFLITKPDNRLSVTSLRTLAARCE